GFSLTGQSDKSVTTVSQNVFTSPTTGAWSNLTPASFTIAENDPGASWLQGQFSCNYVGSSDPAVTGASPTIVLTAGQAWTCQVINTKKSSIMIVKDAQPNTSTPFQFVVGGGGQPTNFSLVDDGSNTTNSKVLTSITAGQTYTITEIQPTDGSYALSAIN